MSDSLASLPYPKNVQYTDDEVETHSLFLNGDGVETTTDAKDVKYLVLYACILFILLSTSFSDDFVKKIPYCDSTLTCLVMKTLIFALGMLVMWYFLL